MNFSCKDLTNDKVEVVEVEVSECTLETINQEIEQFSSSFQILDSIFHLNTEQIQQFQVQEFKHSERNDIILKFVSRLNDEGELKTNCKPTRLINLKIGDVAFYCLAKTEKFPFAKATGRQNCTETNISEEIRIPKNFIYYTSFERERLTNKFLKYLHSEERLNYIKEKGL